MSENTPRPHLSIVRSPESPPPPTSDPTPGVLATRPDLAADVRQLASAARAPATVRAYESDWRVFAAWCTEHQARALPATEETVVAFLAESARSKSLATILRYRSSISVAHKRAGATNPAFAPRVGEVVEGLRRTKGTRPERAKAAMTSEELTAAVGAGGRPQAPLSIRDRAILTLGLASALRRSELCGLDLDDLEWREEGVVLAIRRSKTDQHGEGRVVGVPKRSGSPLCPIEALRAWIKLLPPGATGPIFRPLARDGSPLPRRLEDRAVLDATKRAAEAAGLDPNAFGAHSLRAGYVTEARRAGQAWMTIMEQTGHRKLDTVKRYDRGGSDPFKAANPAAVFAPFDGRQK